MKSTLVQRRLVRQLNDIIHTRNLYVGHSRFINAHVSHGAVCVENLATGTVIALALISHELRDGNGRPVRLF